jgi:lipopolysaccharide biosynthesis regulator YciM
MTHNMFRHRGQIQRALRIRGTMAAPEIRVSASMVRKNDLQME